MIVVGCRFSRRRNLLRGPTRGEGEATIADKLHDERYLVPVAVW